MANGTTVGITGGTFQLTFNGVAGTSVPYSATAAQLQASLPPAISSNVSITATPGSTTGSFLVSFTGPLAGTPMADVGDITTNGDGITLSTNTLAGAPISTIGSDFFGGTTVSVIPNSVVVSGSPGQYDVEFLGDVAAPGQAPSTLVAAGAGPINNTTVNVGLVNASNDVQLVNVTGNSGTFTLSYNGQTTVPLAFNATPLQVQAALQVLSSISPNNVNNNFNVSVAGSPGAVPDRLRRAFSGVGQSVSNLVAAGSGGAAVTVLQTDTSDTDVQFINVSGSTGTFVLAFNGMTTAALPTSATAAQVQSALQSLATIGAGNVLVAGSAGSYSVDFIGSFSGRGQTLLPLVTNGSGGALSTVVQGASTTAVQVVNVSGAPGTITSTGTTGTFKLTFNGQTTASLNYNATAAQVQTALQALTNIGSNVSVAAGPTTATSVSYVVSFSGPLAGTLASALGNVVTAGDVITYATFTLVFNGQTTSAIPAGSSAATVQNALQALSSLGGVNANNVLVTGSTGNYYVEFVGAFVGQGLSVPLMTASGLNGVAAVAAPASNYNDDVQLLTVTGTTGTFTLNFQGGKTPPLCPSGPALRRSRRP